MPQIFNSEPDGLRLVQGTGYGLSMPVLPWMRLSALTKAHSRQGNGIGLFFFSFFHGNMP